jgi:hypothetical protein
MSASRNFSMIGLLVVGVAWLAFAAFDFADARWFRALVALVLALGAFLASWYVRRSRP